MKNTVFEIKILLGAIISKLDPVGRGWGRTVNLRLKSKTSQREEKYVYVYNTHTHIHIHTYLKKLYLAIFQS